MKKTACQPPRRVLGSCPTRGCSSMSRLSKWIGRTRSKAPNESCNLLLGAFPFQRVALNIQAREERSNDRTQASWKSKVAGCAICPIQCNQSALERRGTLCGEDLPHGCFTETVLHLMPQGPGNRVLIRWMAPKRVIFSMQLLPFSGQLHPLRIHQTEFTNQLERMKS